MKAREQLEAELARIQARTKRRDEQNELDSRRGSAIISELRALVLVPLVGVPDGVMMRFRGQEKRIPDDATGTLTKIGRTLCQVDFGEHGAWRVPFSNLIASSESNSRGWTMEALLAGTRPPTSNATETESRDDDRPF